MKTIEKTCRDEKQGKWEEVFCCMVQRCSTPVPWQHCQGKGLCMTSYKSFLFSEPWDSEITFSLANHVVQKSGCIQQELVCSWSTSSNFCCNKMLQKVRVCSLETKVQQMGTMRFTSEMFFSSELKFEPELKASQGCYNPCC